MVFYLQCCRDAHGDCRLTRPKIGPATLSCPTRWMGYTAGPLPGLNDLKVYLLIGQCWPILKNHTCVFKRLQSKSCAVPLLQSRTACCRNSGTSQPGAGSREPTCLCRPQCSISRSFTSLCHGSLFPVKASRGLRRHRSEVLLLTPSLRLRRR